MMLQASTWATGWLHYDAKRIEPLSNFEQFLKFFYINPKN